MKMYNHENDFKITQRNMERERNIFEMKINLNTVLHENSQSRERRGDKVVDQIFHKDGKFRTLSFLKD
jgi:hypothetical protein